MYPSESDQSLAGQTLSCFFHSTAIPSMIQKETWIKIQLKTNITLAVYTNHRTFSDMFCFFVSSSHSLKLPWPGHTAARFHQFGAEVGGQLTWWFVGETVSAGKDVVGETVLENGWTSGSQFGQNDDTDWQPCSTLVSTKCSSKTSCSKPKDAQSIPKKRQWIHVSLLKSTSDSQICSPVAQAKCNPGQRLASRDMHLDATGSLMPGKPFSKSHGVL